MPTPWWRALRRSTGALLVIPPERHAVAALEDSTILLTVAKP